MVVVPAGVHATDFGAAARIYWTLKVAGHPAVSILDGGYAAWAAERPTRSRAGTSKPSPKIFTATLDKRVCSREVEAVERNGDATLVDARPATLLRRQGEGAGRQGLRPHSGRGQSRQRDASTMRRPTG